MYKSFTDGEAFLLLAWVTVLDDRGLEMIGELYTSRFVQTSGQFRWETS